MDLILEDIDSKIYTIRGVQVMLDYIKLKQKYLIKQ